MIRASPRTPQEMPPNQRHPWQLPAIATAIATWLGALSRSHSTRAHHKGGANSGEVQKTAQGERKSCLCTWKTPAPRAHHVVHRAHRVGAFLIDTWKGEGGGGRGLGGEGTPRPAAYGRSHTPLPVPQGHTCW